MSHTGPTPHPPRECSRCGGLVTYDEAAIIPGDPAAPPGSHRGAAHAQPAWTCINCGHVEPQERRAKSPRASEPPARA